MTGVWFLEFRLNFFLEKFSSGFTCVIGDFAMIEIALKHRIYLVFSQTSFYISGITSYGIGCGLANVFGVYRVSFLLFNQDGSKVPSSVPRYTTMFKKNFFASPGTDPWAS